MADRNWTGGDVDIAQVNTVTIGGTWVAADTISLTISDKILVLTLGTDIALDVILDNLVIAVSGVGTFSALYSASFLGNTSGEFSELVATEDGATILTLTAATPGTPFVLTTSRVTASSGTVADATPTANNSKNDYENPRNFAEGVVPVASDVVLVENTDVSILYNIDQSAVALTSLTVRNTFTGDIGLPETNEEGGIPFPEYRGTFFETASPIITIGEGEGTGSGRIKIDSGATAAVVTTVRATGSATDTDLGAFIWKGTGANSDFIIDSGEVGLGVIALDDADIDSITILEATVRQVNGTLDTVIVNGEADVDLRGDIATLLETRGGTTTVRGDLPTTTRARGGIVNLAPIAPATVGDLIIFGTGSVDMTAADGTITAAACNMFAGASLTDPNEKGIYSAGIVLNAASLLEVTIDVGTDVTITPS